MSENSTARKQGVLLVIDDDRAIIETLSVHWTGRPMPYIVRFAETAEEGLRVLATHPVEIVLTDQQLPDATGLFLLNEINRRYPLVRVILMTARANEETKAKALALGAIDFVPKPFNLDHLDRLLVEMKAMETLGLTGVIRNLSLADLVQLKCSTLARAKIVLRGQGHEGMIAFDNGAMIHATLGELQGEEAFYKMFSWRKAAFEEFPLSGEIERNLKRNWEGLLLEAAQKKDENIVPTDEDFDDVKLEELRSELEKKSSVAEAFQDETKTPPGENALATLSSLGYVDGALLCSRSGSLLGSTIEDKPNQAAAISSFLIQQGQCLGQYLGDRSIRQVYVKSANSQRLVVPRGQTLVGLIFSPDVAIWPARQQIADAISS